MANLLTEEEARERLRSAVRGAGTAKAWATMAGLSPAYVCDVLAGNREVAGAVAARLGLRVVRRYEQGA